MSGSLGSSKPNGGESPHHLTRSKQMKQHFEDFQTNDMFSTPESMKALRDYLEKFSGPEAVIAQTCAMLMYNYIVANYHLTKK